MKSETIVSIIMAVFVIVGLFAWGYFAGSPAGTSAEGTAAPNKEKSLLSAEETLYDFGVISMKNGLVTKEFKITNPTEKDINLKTVLTSCMCTSAFIVNPDGNVKGPFKMPGMGYVPSADELIKAGESRIIRVVYDPNAHGPAGVGQIDRFINLTDDSGGTLQMEIKALVTP